MHLGVICCRYAAEGLLAAPNAAAKGRREMPRDEGNHPWPLRPNLLLLLADDMGWGDWPNANMPLRHLDALAAAGTRFTAFYTPSCICSPARGALLTGRMAIRWGGAGATWHGTAFGAGANGGRVTLDAERGTSTDMSDLAVRPDLNFSL